MSGSNQLELVINGKFLLASLEGMPRVGREITAQFDTLMEDDRFRHIKIGILAPVGAQKFASFKNITITEVGRRKGLLWEQIEFPYFLGDRYSLNFTGTAPVVRRTGCVVVHDAHFFSVPKAFGWRHRLFYSVVSPTVARRYRHVVTVSLHARQEIHHFNVTRRADVAVIALGADHMANRASDESILQKHSLYKNSFLLTNSYHHAHKNIITLFRALKDEPELRPKLVLFGSSTRDHYIRRGIAVPDDVLFVGRVSDEELVALMRNARMFLFPSLTEGFGLPPLEAMALGCPTICANAGAMPEVCGDGAVYADASDPQAWRNTIKNLWADEGRRLRLSQAGKLQASRYTWRRAAEKYLELICGDKPPLAGI